MPRQPPVASHNLQAFQVSFKLHRTLEPSNCPSSLLTAQRQTPPSWQTTREWRRREGESKVLCYKTDPNEGFRVTGDTITITVGTDLPETFHIHETILSERSTFFKAAVSKRWQEGRNGKINLPEDDPSLAGAYFDWLYSFKIPSKSDQAVNVLDDSDIDAEYEYLSHMYVFGEKVVDDDFCNAVIDAIIAKIEFDSGDAYYYPSTKAVNILYEATAEGCPARKMMV